MSASNASAKALLRGLAQASRLVLAYEELPSPSPEERYRYVRLCRVRRALKRDCYQHAESLPRPQDGLFLMHMQAALIGELHGEYALQEREVGSYSDPSTWRVDQWVAPSGEGS